MRVSGCEFDTVCAVAVEKTVAPITNLEGWSPFCASCIHRRMSVAHRHYKEVSS